MSAAPGERRARSVGSAVLVALGSLSLTVALVAGWIDRNVFDSREFAARAVVVLDDGTVRRVLAEEVADQLTKSGSSILVSYRSLLLPLVEDVVGTPAFRSIFRSAVEEAHRTAVSRHAGQATLEMGETLKMLTSTAAVTSPGLADALENQASSVLIDAAPVLDRLDLWRVGERVRWADEAAAVLTIALFAGAVVADRDRRRAVWRIGLGAAAAGLTVVLVTWLAPRFASARIRDAELARAVRGVVSRFTSDLVVLGLWVVVVGVVVAAATTATGPPHVARDLQGQLRRAGRWVRTTRARAAGRRSRADRPGDRAAARLGAGAVAGRVGRWHRRRLHRHDLGRARACSVLRRRDGGAGPRRGPRRDSRLASERPRPSVGRSCDRSPA